MDARTEHVGDLLHEAGEVHHVVHRIVDGADDDWASFYARWLTRHSELGEVLGGVTIRSHLVHELVACDRDYAEAGPEEPCELWYARRVVAGPGSTAAGVGNTMTHSQGGIRALLP
jgi:hypothetical protein